MKENGIKYFEAPFEAKQQRGKFEESGYIEATISSDGDMIMLGAKEILVQTNMKILEFFFFHSIYVLISMFAQLGILCMYISPRINTSKRCQVGMLKFEAESLLLSL